jgi:hypothetical protein
MFRLSDGSILGSSELLSGEETSAYLHTPKQKAPHIPLTLSATELGTLDALELSISSNRELSILDIPT